MKSVGSTLNDLIERSEDEIRYLEETISNDQLKLEREKQLLVNLKKLQELQ